MHDVRVLAPAKVNLALRVGTPRPDGFHPLDTVFESLDLFDEVTASLLDGEESPRDEAGLGATGAGEIALTMEGMGSEDLPADGSNLVIRAAEALRERAGKPWLAAKIHVKKAIPMAGGMAGGSADAAGTLVALNALWDLNYSQEELLRIAAALGSDVPFCLKGGLARGRGRGEELEAVRPGSMHFWVFLTSPEGLSTPAVFREFDRLGSGEGEGTGTGPEVAPGDDLGGNSDVSSEVSEAPASTEKLCVLLGKEGIEALAPLMVNDLEAPAFSLRPDLKKIMDEVAGAGIAILSGSGPTIAILTEDFSEANALAGQLRGRFPGVGVIRANGPAAGAHITSTN